MLKLTGITLTAVLGLAVFTAAPAHADAKIYPYASSHNFCPAGLQPVTIDGSISCGTPNVNISYQSAIAHPVAKQRHVVRRSHKPTRSQCQVGTKGCTFD